MNKTLPLALLSVLLTGCGLMPRVMTGNGPAIIAQVHQKADGFLTVLDLGLNRCREIECSSRLMGTLSNEALVGATVAIWMNGDDLATRIRITGHDRFDPNACVSPRRAPPPGAAPAIYQPAILTTKRVSP